MKKKKWDIVKLKKEYFDCSDVFEGYNYGVILEARGDLSSWTTQYKVLWENGIISNPTENYLVQFDIVGNINSYGKINL